MKEDFINLLEENKFILSITLMILIFPLPELLFNISTLDFFIVLNLICFFVFLFIVICIKKVKSFYFYPLLFILFTFSKLVVIIAATRLILLKGTEFDSMIIKVFSLLIIGSENERFIMVFLIFLIIVLLYKIISVQTENQGIFWFLEEGLFHIKNYKEKLAETALSLLQK